MPNRNSWYRKVNKFRTKLKIILMVLVRCERRNLHLLITQLRTVLRLRLTSSMQQQTKN